MVYVKHPNSNPAFIFCFNQMGKKKKKRKEKGKKRKKTQTT
jgi:hypothetical protein